MTEKTKCAVNSCDEIVDKPGNAEMAICALCGSLASDEMGAEYDSALTCVDEAVEYYSKAHAVRDYHAVSVSCDMLDRVWCSLVDEIQAKRERLQESA